MCKPNDQEELRFSYRFIQPVYLAAAPGNAAHAALGLLVSTCHALPGPRPWGGPGKSRGQSEQMAPLSLPDLPSALWKLKKDGALFITRPLHSAAWHLSRGRSSIHVGSSVVLKK